MDTVRWRVLLNWWHSQHSDWRSWARSMLTLSPSSALLAGADKAARVRDVAPVHLGLQVEVVVLHQVLIDGAGIIIRLPGHEVVAQRVLRVARARTLTGHRVGEVAPGTLVLSVGGARLPPVVSAIVPIRHVDGLQELVLSPERIQDRLARVELRAFLGVFAA
jgi:hypothetical protein